MELLLVVSGKKSEIIKINNLPENIISKKIDEKDLSNFGYVNKLIKNEKINKIYFSVYSLDYLRFSFFMKLFCLLNGIKGEIIDQFGRKIEYKTLPFIFIDIPKFIIEILFSALVVIYYQAKFIFKGEKI